MTDPGNVFRANLDTGNRGDLEAWLDIFSSDSEWTSAITSRVDGTETVYRGHDELRRFWHDNREAWSRFDAELTYLLEFRGDKAVRSRAFVDEAEAVSAALERGVSREEQAAAGIAGDG